MVGQREQECMLCRGTGRADPDDVHDMVDCEHCGGDGVLEALVPSTPYNDRAHVESANGMISRIREGGGSEKDVENLISIAQAAVHVEEDRIDGLDSRDRLRSVMVSLFQ